MVDTFHIGASLCKSGALQVKPFSSYGVSKLVKLRKLPKIANFRPHLQKTIFDFEAQNFPKPCSSLYITPKKIQGLVFPKMPLFDFFTIRLSQNSKKCWCWGDMEFKFPFFFFESYMCLLSNALYRIKIRPVVILQNFFTHSPFTLASWHINQNFLKKFCKITTGRILIL